MGAQPLEPRTDTSAPPSAAGTAAGGAAGAGAESGQSAKGWNRSQHVRDRALHSTPDPALPTPTPAQH
jgi:hypothetical protein